jgi:hypothetical protein
MDEAPARTAKAGEVIKVRVVEAARLEPEVKQSIREIDERSPLAHPFQTEPFAALLNTDPSRAAYVIVAENGEDLLAHWWGYFVQYRPPPLARSSAWVRSGPVVREELIERRGELLPAMLAALKRRVRRLGVGWIIFTSEALYGSTLTRPLLDAGFARRDLETYLLDLTHPTDDVWHRLDKGTRWAVNRANKNGVTVGDAESEEDVRSYHRLYLETSAVPGDGPPSEEQFVRGFRRMREESKGRLLLAKHEDEVVAGSFFPCNGGFSAQHQNAVSRQARSLNAGDLLIWRSMMLFKEAGCHSLDLVSTEIAPPAGSREEGVRHFKAKWGGQRLETPVYQYRSPLLRLWRSIARRLRSR